MLRLPSRFALPLFLFVAAGCSGGHADFTGTVTYKGKPIYKGSITIVGADKKVRVAAIGEDGNFAFESVPTGTVMIGILCPEPLGDVPSKQSDLAKKLSQMGPASSSPSEARKKWFKIPSRYGEPETSGLSAEIVKPATTNVIELKD